MDFEPVVAGCYLEGMLIDGETLWFTDPVVGGVFRRAPDGRTERWLPERRWMGAILLNADGRVICSGPGGIAWFDPATGTSGMLLEAVDGEPLMGVNEMIPDGKGGLYFGTIDIPAIERGETSRPGAYYRLDETGRARKERQAGFTNAIGLSPDGRRLYANVSFDASYVYEVAADGSLGEAKLFLEKADADGLAVDQAGDVWITGFATSELLCLAPDGSERRCVPTPAQAVTNIRFGGADGRDAYITGVTGAAVDALKNGEPPPATGSTIYRARSEVAGLPIPRTGFRLG
jgi:sugar lactone lactonase YvrE